VGGVWQAEAEEEEHGWQRQEEWNRLGRRACPIHTTAPNTLGMLAIRRHGMAGGKYLSLSISPVTRNQQPCQETAGSLLAAGICLHLPLISFCLASLHSLKMRQAVSRWKEEGRRATGAADGGRYL